jgi:hypothetical protein
MELLVENHTLSGAPLAVRSFATMVYSSATGTPAAEVRLLLADNTEVLTTGSLSVKNSTDDPGVTITLYKRMCIAPAGGWDNTKIDGLKFRIGFDDLAADANFIDLMIEALYFTAGGGGPVDYPMFTMPDEAIYPGPSTN